MLISFSGQVSYPCYGERKGSDVILFQYFESNANYSNYPTKCGQDVLRFPKPLDSVKGPFCAGVKGATTQCGSGVRAT